MDPAKFKDAVEKIAEYTDAIILACLLIVEILAFYKLKFKIDKSGLLTLLIHLIASITRVVRTFFQKISIIFIFS